MYRFRSIETGFLIGGVIFSLSVLAVSIMEPRSTLACSAIMAILALSFCVSVSMEVMRLKAEGKPVMIASWLNYTGVRRSVLLTPLAVSVWLALSCKAATSYVSIIVVIMSSIIVWYWDYSLRKYYESGEVQSKREKTKLVYIPKSRSTDDVVIQHITNNSSVVGSDATSVEDEETSVQPEESKDPLKSFADSLNK